MLSEPANFAHSPALLATPSANFVPLVRDPYYGLRIRALQR